MAPSHLAADMFRRLYVNIEYGGKLMLCGHRQRHVNGMYGNAWRKRLYEAHDYVGAVLHRTFTSTSPSMDPAATLPSKCPLENDISAVGASMEPVKPKELIESSSAS